VASQPCAQLPDRGASVIVPTIVRHGIGHGESP
jgi:hypothetical protein